MSKGGDFLGGKPIDSGDKIQLQTNAVGLRVAAQMALMDVEIRFDVLSMSAIEISSSHIRRCCAENRDLSYLVPEVVRTYIVAHQLYQ